MPVVDVIPLHETARERYLNYALSVITSRALPDIRDGLKPVQRRILYAMYTNLRLTPDSRFRKSATVVGECFVADTLVATEQGLIPIQHIERGDRVFTERGLKPVTELFEMPSKPLLDVRLENGLVNTVTPTQPIRVIGADLAFSWKSADRLEPGDWVVLKKAACFPTRLVPLGDFDGRAYHLDERVAYLLGVLMADGWVSADYGRQRHLRLGFCSSDWNVVERVRTILQEVFGYTPTVEEGEVYSLRINHKALNRFFVDRFGLRGDLVAQTKFIPAAVLRSPASVAKAFVAGLFDGDGCLDTRSARARYVSTSKRLVDQLQVLLLHLGILGGRHEMPAAADRPSALHSLEIHGAYAQKLAREIPFVRQTLMERAEAVAKMRVHASRWDRLPHGGAVVFSELSDRHLGAGWYADCKGKRFRQGIAYASGSKIRYSADLADQPLTMSQVEEWGILKKLDRIGSDLTETLGGFREHGLLFVRVESIRPAPPEPTYDLQVADDHNFVANGMVVHNCMGKYHPHGDTAIYDAMVRMAQPFSLRAPLVDGHGNFGSLDGDSPAAMRYTEARLTPLGASFSEEIRKQTVHFRPNYDGTLFEPVVLPAQFPNLLVNGATGIAVGMATNIPPHNLGEVIDAAIYLIGSPNAYVRTLVENHVKSPDFPTGGRILNTQEELVAIYENGEGAVDLRGSYELEGKSRAVITSIPYGLAKGDLIEKIADHIREGKVPQIVDIRDESTEDVRIVLEIKRGADAEAAMAYLFKHTPLQSRFHVNMTCLVPTDNPEVAAPKKVNLREALQAFLDFRFETVTKRLRFDLEQLEKRIHILRGFVKIFDALDEAIKIIRSSKNKADAAQRLMHRFGIDDLQADAVLEIKLYRLARMEMDAIRAELADKEQQAAALRKLLGDDRALWNLIKAELRDLKKQYADERRTEIAGPDAVLEYSAEDYIMKEDVYVIVTRDGWVKRQRSYTELDAIRVREGDAVAYALAGSTRATVCFFTSAGRAYTIRIDDLPQTTGYGDPVQKYFDFKDKEHVVGVISLDERILPESLPDFALEDPTLFQGDGAPADVETGPFGVAITDEGMAVRFTLESFADPSNKNGRVFMRIPKGAAAVGVEVARGDENVCLASKEGRGLVFPVHQIPTFKSAAKGVIAMRLSGKDDRVLGFVVSDAAREGLEVETSRGRKEIVRTTKFEVTNRGNKGRTIIERGTLRAVTPPPVELHLNGRN